ncbi:MAG: type II toxin-antitoxin system VapC family toxin [Candidatus Aenigmarchaeota archaeon]|nr:type II toxin-antitoxin system VapC family toxin [Candidatus Aenigmarchaeota archaeon]
MKVMVDTSVLIDLDTGYRPTLERFVSLKELSPTLPSISFMAYYEFIHGLRKRNPKNREKSLAFIQEFVIVHTTLQTAAVLSLLKERYPSCSLADLFIAAQAIENGMMLVTRDLDFEKIAELDKIILS